MINGYTRTCGLIGNPVEHTMSPAIHNYLAEELEENLVYVPFHVQPGYVGDGVRGAFALNLLGCNVTVPYKSQVIPFLSEIDSLAETIGAVNTLVRTDSGFKGHNTDMPGLYRAMEADGVRISGEHVLILGAGGVARAVAVLLAHKGAESIILLNRSVEKAWGIAREVNQLAGRELAGAMSLKDYSSLSQEHKYLAVQATSVGMYPNVEEAVVEDRNFYERIHTGYDLVFNPDTTRFMSLTEENGGKAFNGLKMLLYQGIIAFELWTGRQVTEELAQGAFERMLKAMGRNV